MNKIYFRLVIAFLILISVTGYVQAYIITIDTPQSVVRGSPLIVTGSTTFPQSAYFDLILYYSKYTAGEITRQQIIVVPNQDFRVSFDTKNLSKGQYKVEIHNVIYDNKEFANQQLGSASVLSKIIQITDRSDEITITSPQTQPLKQALTISGRMKDLGNGVVTIRVLGPEKFISGPLQVVAAKEYTGDYGDFSTTVQVPGSGEYTVSISDKNGFIGEYTFIVSDNPKPVDEITQKPVSTLQPELTPVENTTQIPTEKPFPLVTATASPLSPLGIVLALSLVIIFTAGSKVRKKK